MRPFLGGAQCGKQLVESHRVIRRVLEPGEEIERLMLREIPAMMEPSRQCGKMLESKSRMLRPVFEDALALA